MSSLDAALPPNPDKPIEPINSVEEPVICQPIIAANNSIETPTDIMHNINSIDPTTYQIFTHINNHPQAPDTPVIINVNWDDLPNLSDPDTSTLFAKEIFKHGNYWKNKKTLYKELEQFGAKTGFTPTTLEGTCFGCNRAGKQRIRSDTGVARKNLQVNYVLVVNGILDLHLL